MEHENWKHKIKLTSNKNAIPKRKEKREREWERQSERTWEIERDKKKYERTHLAKDELIEHAMYTLITYRLRNSISEVKICSNSFTFLLK